MTHYPKIRVLDNNRRVCVTTARYNDGRTKEAIEEYGDNALRTLLPTDSPSHARIMNLLTRNNIDTKAQLNDLDLASLESISMVGTKTIEYITAMRELALFDAQLSNHANEATA